MQKEVVTKIDVQKQYFQKLKIINQINNKQDANKLISDKFSMMKTTCKAFIAFYKEFGIIQQNYADALLKLTKTSKCMNNLVGQIYWQTFWYEKVIR